MTNKYHSAKKKKKKKKKQKRKLKHKEHLPVVSPKAPLQSTLSEVASTLFRLLASHPIK